MKQDDYEEAECKNQQRVTSASENEVDKIYIIKYIIIVLNGCIHSSWKLHASEATPPDII